MDRKKNKKSPPKATFLIEWIYFITLNYLCQPYTTLYYLIIFCVSLNCINVVKVLELVSNICLEKSFSG